MTQKSITEYEKVGDSVSLTKIDGHPFVIVAKENSDYEGKKGYKITTKEFYPCDVQEDGKTIKKRMNKFHTTRHAIVGFLDKSVVTEDLKSGVSIGPVVCEKVKAKNPGVDDYWILKESK